MRKLGLVLVIAATPWTACKTSERAATAISSDAAAAPADDAAVLDAAIGRWGERDVMVVVELDGRWFVAIEDWYQPADGSKPSTNWVGAAPVTELGHRIMLQAAAHAPAAWRTIVGQPLATRAADGTTCATTIAGLFWLATSNTVEIENDATFVAELRPEAGCAPVVITPHPIVRAGTKIAVAAAELKRVTTAFRALPAYRALSRAYPDDTSGDAAAWGFRFDDVTRVVIVKWFAHPVERSCHPDPRMLRAEYALSGTTPRLEWQSQIILASEPRALFDSNGDGVMEQVTGVATVDGGMTMDTYVAGYLDPALPEGDETPDGTIAVSRYGGCD